MSGMRVLANIRGALRGGWVNVNFLITDRVLAEALIGES